MGSNILWYAETKQTTNTEWYMVNFRKILVQSKCFYWKHILVRIIPWYNCHKEITNTDWYLVSLKIVWYARFNKCVFYLNIAASNIPWYTWDKEIKNTNWYVDWYRVNFEKNTIHFFFFKHCGQQYSLIN